MVRNSEALYLLEVCIEKFSYAVLAFSHFFANVVHLITFLGRQCIGFLVIASTCGLFSQNQYLLRNKHWKRTGQLKQNRTAQREHFLMFCKRSGFQCMKKVAVTTEILNQCSNIWKKRKKHKVSASLGAMRDQRPRWNRKFNTAPDQLYQWFLIVTPKKNPMEWIYPFKKSNIYCLQSINNNATQKWRYNLHLHVHQKHNQWKNWHCVFAIKRSNLIINICKNKRQKISFIAAFLWRQVNTVTVSQNH